MTSGFEVLSPKLIQICIVFSSFRIFQAKSPFFRVGIAFYRQKMIQYVLSRTKSRVSTQSSSSCTREHLLFWDLVVRTKKKPTMVALSPRAMLRLMPFVEDKPDELGIVTKSEYNDEIH